MKERLGGWQFWVEIKDDYVIKTPKNPEEVSVNVERYLKHINKMEELDMQVSKVMNALEISTEILKESKIPRELLANLEFLDEGKIKQTKVKILREELPMVGEEEAKKIIDDAVDFLIEIWKYGVHENTFKFDSNLGLMDEKIVLIDPFEITDKKEKVEKQINNRRWFKPRRLENNPLKRFIEYFNEQMDKKMTLEKLNETWRTE